ESVERGRALLQAQQRFFKGVYRTLQHADSRQLGFVTGLLGIDLALLRRLFGIGQCLDQLVDFETRTQTGNGADRHAVILDGLLTPGPRKGKFQTRPPLARGNCPTLEKSNLPAEQETAGILQTLGKLQSLLRRKLADDFATLPGNYLDHDAPGVFIDGELQPTLHLIDEFLDSLDCLYHTLTFGLSHGPSLGMNLFVRRCLARLLTVSNRGLMCCVKGADVESNVHHIISPSKERAPKAPPLVTQGLLTQQLQHGGRQLVGLRQDRGGSLLQSLVLGQISSFSGEVDVLDTAAGSGGVFRNGTQVG